MAILADQSITWITADEYGTNIGRYYLLHRKKSFDIVF